MVARSAALVLHFDVSLILFRMLPKSSGQNQINITFTAVCRTLISLLRQTPLNGIIQFGKSSRTAGYMESLTYNLDKNITFHKRKSLEIDCR